MRAELLTGASKALFIILNEFNDGINELALQIVMLAVFGQWAIESNLNKAREQSIKNFRLLLLFEPIKIQINCFRHGARIRIT